MSSVRPEEFEVLQNGVRGIDQQMSNCVVKVTNNISKSGVVEDMEYKGFRILHLLRSMQWPPLMEALRSNGNYDGTNYLRITAIKWADHNNDDQCLLYSSHTGRRLSEYASSVGMPFLFQETNLERPEKCRGRGEGDCNSELHMATASHVQSAK